MPDIPVFPLSQPVLPGMPSILKVFEPRYLKMFGDILNADTPEFGVVLIERGHEVGGGDTRFGVGTLVEVSTIEAPEGFLIVVGHGTSRFVVTEWLGDDPYPRASVMLRDDLDTSSLDEAILDTIELEVRDTLALAHEFDMGVWPVDTSLSDDPEIRLWQLAGISPLSEIDHLTLLSATTAEELIDELLLKTRQLREELQGGSPAPSQ